MISIERHLANHPLGAIVERIEHVTRHGDFRVVATAEKMPDRRAGEACWQVRVSLWKASAGGADGTPEMIKLDNWRSARGEEALSEGIDLAVRRIDNRTA